MKAIVLVLINILCFFLFFCDAWPAQATITLPPSIVIGDSDGVYATSEGEYFIDLVGILPGEVYKKEITIRSLDLETPFSLGMLVEEIESTGPINWKNHITMTLILDGKQIYKGSILGDNSRDWGKSPLKLGVYEYGSDKLLNAEFVVDSNLTNENLREVSTLNFYWVFVGTKDQVVEATESQSSVPISEKRLPYTGEKIVYMFLSGLLLILIVLFLWKKWSEEDEI